MQMGIGFISSYLKKRGRKRLRNLMRGYRVLNHQYGLDKLDELTENLYETPFYNKKINFSEVVFGSATKDADKIVRQFMLVSFARFKLNVSLLRSLGSSKALIFPLPRQWRKVVKSHGFAVNDFRSEVLWNFKIFLNYTYSLINIVRTIFRGINESLSGNGTALGKYVYFDSINKNNLPKKLKDGRSFDIITWYEKLEIRSKNIEAITHNVSGVRNSDINGIPLIFIQSGIPPLNRSSQIFSYTIWGVKAFLVGFVGIITCRWWNALMLNEAAKARQVSFQDSSRLPSEYFFHHGNWLYRPLWTYEAVNKGSLATLYFYSTNNERFKRPEGYPKYDMSCWKAMTWDNYIVWDEYQADFIKRAVGKDINIHITGAVLFSNSLEEMPEIPKNSIGVFDVQPFRDSRYQMLGEPIEYYTAKTANDFLNDIHTAAKIFESTMVLKCKRKIGHLLHPSYGRMVKKLTQSTETFVAIDENISALRLINKCAVVISMPFTSTAILAKHLGKPSVYYDPHGIIHKDDRASHGIPILTGFEELKSWLSKQAGQLKKRENG
jgi:polysaccharide biosynthesis PFTS motif protein